MGADSNAGGEGKPGLAPSGMAMADARMGAE
jgi:hypothetical protein